MMAPRVAGRAYQDRVAEFFRSLGMDATVEGARAQHDIDVLVEFEKLGIRHRWSSSASTGSAASRRSGSCRSRASSATSVATAASFSARLAFRAARLQRRGSRTSPSPGSPSCGRTPSSTHPPPVVSLDGSHEEASGSLPEPEPPGEGMRSAPSGAGGRSSIIPLSRRARLRCRVPSSDAASLPSVLRASGERARHLVEHLVPTPHVRPVEGGVILEALVVVCAAVGAVVVASTRRNRRVVRRPGYLPIQNPPWAASTSMTP